MCKLKLHKPLTRLTVYQRSVCCNSMRIYNKLPDDLAKLVSNKKCFLLRLKYLTDKPFYSVEECLNARKAYDVRHNALMFVYKFVILYLYIVMKLF